MVSERVPAITPAIKISVLAACMLVSALPARRQSAICVIMHGPISGEESLRVLLNVFITMMCVERTISLSYLRAST